MNGRKKNNMELWRSCLAVCAEAGGFFFPLFQTLHKLLDNASCSDNN